MFEYKHTNVFENATQSKYELYMAFLFLRITFIFYSFSIFRLKFIYKIGNNFRRMINRFNCLTQRSAPLIPKPKLFLRKTFTFDIRSLPPNHSPLIDFLSPLTQGEPIQKSSSSLLPLFKI